jgi:hypothetical protein
LRVHVFKTDVPPAQAGAGLAGEPLKGVLGAAKTEEDDLLVPGGTQIQAVIFRKGKGGPNIRRGFQGVHQQHTADDGFQVSPALHPAGDFHPGFIGKGDKVKGVPQPQVAPEERAGKVIVNLPVITAHTGGGIQQEDQVNGVPVLPKGRGDLLSQQGYAQ